jgi:hypothetical protein
VKSGSIFISILALVASLPAQAIRDEDFRHERACRNASAASDRAQIDALGSQVSEVTDRFAGAKDLLAKDDDCLKKLTQADLQVLEGVVQRLSQGKIDQAVLTTSLSGALDSVRGENTEDRKNALLGLLSLQAEQLQREQQRLEGRPSRNWTDVGVERVLRDPSLSQEFRKQFPMSEAEWQSIQDPERRQPLFLGSQVVMPVRYTDSGERIAPLISISQYQAEAQAKLTKVKDLLREYLAEGSKTKSEIGLWGGFKAYYFGSTSMLDQVEKENEAGNKVARLIFDLERNYGLDPELIRGLRRGFTQASRSNSQKAQEAMDHALYSMIAVCAAPVAYPIIAVGGTTAVIGMGIGAGVAGAGIVSDAVVSRSKTGGSLLCNLGKSLSDRGPEAVATILMGGAGGAVFGRVGPLGKEVVKTIGLAASAYTAKGALQQGGAALGQAEQTTDLLRHAKTAAESGDPELAQILRAQAALSSEAATQGAIQASIDGGLAVLGVVGAASRPTRAILATAPPQAPNGAPEPKVKTTTSSPSGPVASNAVELSPQQPRAPPRPTPERLQAMEEMRLKFEATELPKLTGSTTLRSLPPGDIPNRSSYEGIRSLMEDPKRIFARMQELETEVLNRANAKGKMSEEVLPEVLAEMEARNGFGKAISINDALTKDQWRQMLRNGKLFNDNEFADSAIRDGTRNPHGGLTHRLQWNLVMREMELNPSAFVNESGKVPKAVDLFKGLGDPKVYEKLQWGEARQYYQGDLWYLLFDQRVPSTFSSPETFRSMHNFFPGLGLWN